jgi:hypothetical protein
MTAMALPATALITAKAGQAIGEQEAVDARPRQSHLCRCFRRQGLQPVADEGWRRLPAGEG